MVDFPLSLEKQRTGIEGSREVGVRRPLIRWLLQGTIYVGACVPTVRAQDAVKRPLSAAAAAAPSSAPASLSEALQLYYTGKLDAAATEYRALINAGNGGPEAALAYAGFARVLLKKKAPAEAYDAAAKAVELAPHSDAAHTALGEVYFRQGRITQAESEFRPLVRSSTAIARAYLGLARIYHAASYYQQWKLLIDQAYALNPLDPDIRRERIRTLSLKERIKALQDYLSGETNDDDVGRKGLQHALVTWKDWMSQPIRPCRLITGINSTQVDMERLLYDPHSLRGFGLKAQINGVSSRLLLDTGAPGILINRKLAEKAGVKRVVETDIRGLGDKGAAGGYVGYVDSVKIGELEFRNCYLEVMDKRSVADEDGLIGADVFSRFLVDIDFPNEKFRLSPLPAAPGQTAIESALASTEEDTPRFRDRYFAPEMKSFTPVLRFGHQLLIPTKINNSEPKLFIIDTGAFNDTISPGAAREVTKVHDSQEFRVRGLNGAITDTFMADELTLQFSHFKQPTRDLVAFDTTDISENLGIEVSGFLGFAMLRKMEIKIDYRDGLVDFTYDPQRWH